MNSRTVRIWMTLLLAMVLAAAPSLPALGAQNVGPPPPDKPVKDPKIDHRLQMVPGPIGQRSTSDPAAEPVALEVMVASGTSTGVAESMRSLGGRPVILGDTIGVTLARGSIAALAADPRVMWIRPAAVPFPEAVTAESVAFANADDWQANGHTGAGTAVAILDLGFSGWETKRDAGELPYSTRTQDYCDEPTSGWNTTRHGTAVAEIVHDMAPDAQLTLICIGTIGDLLTAVAYAEAHGITIINHSVGWFNTGRGDGSGALAPVFSAAAAAGITWLNSSGNYAQNHWKGPFSDTDADDFNNFDPANNTLRFWLGKDESASVFLRWDDWPVSNNDYDVYLYRSDGTTLVAFSDEPQTGTQPPTEEFDYTNSGLGQWFHLGIHRYAAATTPEFDLFVVGPADIGFWDPVRSLNDAATSSAVVAVGAASYWDGVIEDFSSQGPTIDGVRKPDLTGPDGLSTATYGTNAFFGTSASAPAVAGATALLQGTDRCATRSEVRTAVLAHTVDAGAGGADNVYGEGLISLGAAPADQTTLRFEGADRYFTSIEISEASHPCFSRVVYVATGMDHPDAIAAGPAAAEQGAPILLTPSNELRNTTRLELQRLDPDLVVILGGPAAISDAVVAAIDASLSPATVVERHYGANRYSTSADVSEYAFAAGVERVYVATGETFHAAAIAAAAGVSRIAPVLLVGPGGLQADVHAELDRLSPNQIVIVGSTAEVSEFVKGQLEAIATTRRISGTNAYTLSAAVSADSWPNGAYTVSIAVGDKYPDALAGGPLTRIANGPLLLVQTNSLPAAVATELDRLDPTRIVILGGTAAVSAAVAAEIATYQQ